MFEFDLYNLLKWHKIESSRTLKLQLSATSSWLRKTKSSTLQLKHLGYFDIEKNIVLQLLFIIIDI